MLKKTMTTVDFGGTERTEDYYFNLTKAEITWFRVYSFRLIALFRLAFASATHFEMLNLAGKSNS